MWCKRRLTNQTTIQEEIATIESVPNLWFGNNNKKISWNWIEIKNYLLIKLYTRTGQSAACSSKHLVRIYLLKKKIVLHFEDGVVDEPRSVKLSIAYRSRKGGRTLRAAVCSRLISVHTPLAIKSPLLSLDLHRCWLHSSTVHSPPFFALLYLCCHTATS